jgi:cellobiose phosphorylase
MALRGKFWSFSDDGTEFTFTKRDLRYPWRNFLHTNRLKCQVSHTGAGGAFDRSPHNDRLLPESNPRLVFVRDQADGAVWTLNGVDTPAAPADWQCTHGFGYTRLQSTRQDIAGSVTYFVPMDEPTEIWQIRLENRSRQARRLPAGHDPPQRGPP